LRTVTYTRLIFLLLLASRFTSGSFRSNLLLVDDEQDITTVMKKSLEQRGFHVDTFNSANQALRQFRPNYYDFIITDIRMPAMTGFELAREIWVKDARARICFLSALEIYEDEAKKVFTNFKTYCFIRKPVTAAALAQHIEAHLLTA
jgi:DNA-binding response OmpR family regulator